MKNLFKTHIGVACLVIGISSCSDGFLKEKKDYNNMTTVDVYSDKGQATAAFAKLYKQCFETYNSLLCGADPIMRHDKNIGGQQARFSEEMTGWKGSYYDGSVQKQVKAGNHISNPPYQNAPRPSTKDYSNFDKRTLHPTVYVINNFIQEIERSRSLIADNVFWDRLEGQATFMRAWLFFDAVREWDGFPYYCTDIDMPDMDTRPLRMPMQECIDKVCEDFKLAASLLPAKWDSENYGRSTFVAALTMSTRVRIFMASPIFNANWDNPDSQRWQQALEASLAALKAADDAGYGTSVTDINPWDKAFYGFNNTFNPESIITLMTYDDLLVPGVFNKWENKIRPSVVASNDGAGIPALEEILRVFPMKSGREATPVNGYDDEKFYRDRDPRFYRAFALSGCEWPGVEKPLWFFAYKYSDKDGNMYRYTDGRKGDSEVSGESRAIVWKMSDPKTAIGAENSSSTDVMEHRYGELLLDVAECYAAQGKAECLTYLGEVRSRVGILSTDNYGLGLVGGRYELIKAVLTERQIELAYEGKRPQDLKRWLLLEGGVGFDPNIGGGYNFGTGAYNPEPVWGAGWKIYDSQDGRPSYIRTDNVLTRLGMRPLSGTKHTSKIWAYDIDNIHVVDEYEGDKVNHPLIDNELYKKVPAIKRDMNETEHEVTLNKLDEFYEGVNMKTYDPIEKPGDKYGMDSGATEKDRNFLFVWHGWYYIYPIHYDMCDAGKGNTQIEQTAGWMIENYTPSYTAVSGQNGTYYYCIVEEQSSVVLNIISAAFMKCSGVITDNH